MPPQALILDADSYSELPEGRKAFFFGSGAEKAKGLFNRPDTEYLKVAPLLACDLMALAERSFRHSDFLDVAYSTPFYIKAVHTTKPKDRKF